MSQTSIFMQVKSVELYVDKIPIRYTNICRQN